MASPNPLPQKPRLEIFDRTVISKARHYAYKIARSAIFLIFFWFGVLKVFGISPASPLVSALLSRTLTCIPAAIFLPVFGLFECAIGILFLFPKCTRLTICLIILHIATTFLPLVFLPSIAWTGPFVPTLEGQYIIKNVVILALVVGLIGHMKPMRAEKHNA